MLRTGEQYLKALDDGRTVWVGGEKIDNVATHPGTRDYARRIADFYDLHHRPELKEVMTFQDEEGTTRSMTWFEQHSYADLVRKRRYLETVCRELDGGSVSRTPDANNLTLFTYLDDPRPWSDQSRTTGGRDLVPGILDFIHTVRDNDLNTALASIDPQADRSREAAQRESPALRVIEYRDAGIVVRGVKAVSTGAPFADYVHLGVLYRPGMPEEQVIYGAVPANCEGLSIVCREPTVKVGQAEDHPLASRGDELDCTLVFDDVFIPWNRVFHLGNPEHASRYAQPVFDWVQYQSLVRQTVRAELMVGLALLITGHIGTYQLPPVQARLSKIAGFHRTLTAHVIACEAEGSRTPGGLYKPDVLLTNFGRAHYLEHISAITAELIDLSGRASVIFPTEAQWNATELHDWLEPLQHGATGEPYDRLRVSRVIRDLFLSDWGDRLTTFEHFNGMPLLSVYMHAVKRGALHPDGDITALARQICGLAPSAQSQHASKTRTV